MTEEVEVSTDEPAAGYRGLGREELAELVREYLLCGQLIDRSGMPHVISGWGRETMLEVAIDEWMAASPIYTKRMQQLLGYEGDTVDVMFKGLQLDIGSPPQFMDFRMQVNDPLHGEFWLDHCGALMDVEPMGDDYVKGMCHDIEDPTFDATACAVNPRMRVRPIHRPPRLPADRHPHCHWTVTIDPAADPLPVPPVAQRNLQTLLAQTPVVTILPDDPARPDDAGRRSYDTPLEPDLDLTTFSRATLVAMADEVAVQGHLLTMGLLAAVWARSSEEEAIEVGHKQLVGIAGVTAQRLARAFGLGPGLASIATVLDLHPAFRPRSYVDLRVAEEDDRLVVVLGPCTAREEPVEHPNPKLLAGATGDAAERPLQAIVQNVDPLARAHRIDAPADAPAGSIAWEVVLTDEPAGKIGEVNLTRFSKGADFTFETRVSITPRPG